MKIELAHELSEAAVTAVRQLLKETALRNPDFNGIRFTVARGETTCIPAIGRRDAYDAQSLYNAILQVIEESSDSAQSHLKAAGELLYGTRWQSDLARVLGVGDRRVREWAAGERSTPPGVWTDITALLRQRQTHIEALLETLDHR